MEIQIGVLINKSNPVEGFDFSSYYVKTCTGKINKPANGLVNIISCFGDNRTARKKPEWVAVSKLGKALRNNKFHRFLWDHICPNIEEYRNSLFDLVKKTLKNEIVGIHLDCIGFPRSEYCMCNRCLEKHKDSNFEWVEWRSNVITDFIGQNSEFVKNEGKSFSVTLLPDPCFGKKRFGEDFRSLEKFVDFFIVPLYDTTYSTTYWVETLAYDFKEQLHKPLFVELYATTPGPQLKRLLATILAVSDIADGIILATHSANIAKQIQKNLIQNRDCLNYLERHNCETLIEYIKNWKEKK